MVIIATNSRKDNIRRPCFAMERGFFYICTNSVMKGFSIITPENTIIRFTYYSAEAPLSAAAFDAVLPFSIGFYHARTSGEEFWVANAFTFDVPQENASVFTEPGEVVLGPMKPSRVKAMNGSIGIYYGDGKGLDAANIFAKVVPEDADKLKVLGEKIWKEGARELRFEQL